MRTRILTRRTAGLLGIAGLSAAATVGFAVAAVADPSPGTSGGAPSETPATTAAVTLSGASSVKSGGTATYTTVLSVENGPLKDATVTLGGAWHGGKVAWVKGCAVPGVSDDGITCSLGDVSGTKTITASYAAPKVGENTSVTLTVGAQGKGTNDKELSIPAKSHTLVVKKPVVATPTKTAKPTPTKSSSKPHPTKSHTSHKSHKPSHSSDAKPSSEPSSTPTGNGNVPNPNPLPSDFPTGGVPRIPTGTESPWAPTSTPTNMPIFPSVAPSPEGSARNPNVAEPRQKASGLVHTDAVSVPAAAAAAFVGLGAGTLITRSVRRRGLWRPIGRHRD